MSGPSIYHWGWMRRPDARIEDGLIIDGVKAEPYHPGEYQKDILNAIQRISDEATALDFTRQWGILGLATSAPEVEDHFSQINGAITFVYAARKKENPDIDIKSIHREVLEFFNPNRGCNLTPKGEPISAIIHFAQRIKYLSEAKRLLKLYQEDETEASYEAEEWISGLSIEWRKVFDIENIEFLQKQYERGCSNSDFYHYLLSLIIKATRFSFSHRSERGVWVQLYTSPIAGRPEGHPVIQFDGLFRFIQYILLVDGGPSPKRCADPKCGQLFFPAKADQEYCPPPPGVKRSRCENRHGQWLRRHGISKPKLKKWTT
ncbi:hypothetical protein JCM14036_02860 [Desulfotomaculum defluvii]